MAGMGGPPLGGKNIPYHYSTFPAGMQRGSMKKARENSENFFNFFSKTY